MRRVFWVTLQVLRNIRDFLLGVELPSSVGDFQKQVQLFDASVTALVNVALDQDRHHKNYRQAVEVAKGQAEGLKVRFIAPLARVSNIATPEFPSINVSEIRTFEEVNVESMNLATRVDAQKARFVEAGIKEDFVVRLRDAIAEYHKALATKAGHLRARTVATRGLDREFARARKLVRIIDALLEAEWATSPEKLDAWHQVSHFTKLAKESKPVSPGTPPAGGGDTSTDNRVA